MTKQKAYVQFSKQIVLLVTIAVTAISLLAVVLCFFRSDTDALISTVRTYINYATIVFAAYSGNSVFEKWLTQGKSADADRKSTRLNSSHPPESRMPSSA